MDYAGVLIFNAHFKRFHCICFFSDILCIFIIVLVAIVTDPPEVRYLNRYVRDSLCAAGPNRWHDLGLILTGKSGKNKLDMIKIDQKHSVSGRCDAMFTLWLELDSEPSWNKLIVALREISLEAIASDLTKMRR